MNVLPTLLFAFNRVGIPKFNICNPVQLGAFKMTRHKGCDKVQSLATQQFKGRCQVLQKNVQSKVQPGLQMVDMVGLSSLGASSSGSFLHLYLKCTASYLSPSLPPAKQLPQSRWVENLKGFSSHQVLPGEHRSSDQLTLFSLLEKRENLNINFRFL